MNPVEHLMVAESTTLESGSQWLHRPTVPNNISRGATNASSGQRELLL